ncbi:MAG TPA: hypothetical protein VNB64_04855 [Solirubrobacteraceae bacterium]|nr:hypothetical protein [Solirubrobacteraceae bacterium]
MTRNARIGLILAAVLVAVVAAVVIGGGGDDDGGGAATTAAPATTGTAPARPRPRPIPAFRLRDGKPVGGVGTVEVRSGERVRFAVASDTEQEVHVHGYDIRRTVPAGGRAVISFEASLQGVYEIESHTRSEPIARLRVVP